VHVEASEAGFECEDLDDPVVFRDADPELRAGDAGGERGDGVGSTLGVDPEPQLQGTSGRIPLELGEGIPLSNSRMPRLAESNCSTGT
jgi:hypothetical protein